jgi:hypothetical protein
MSKILSTTARDRQQKIFINFAEILILKTKE